MMSRAEWNRRPLAAQPGASRLQEVISFLEPGVAIIKTNIPLEEACFCVIHSRTPVSEEFLVASRKHRLGEFFLREPSAGRREPTRNAGKNAPIKDQNVPLRR